MAAAAAASSHLRLHYSFMSKMFTKQDEQNHSFQNAIGEQVYRYIIYAEEQLIHWEQQSLKVRK